MSTRHLGTRVGEHLNKDDSLKNAKINYCLVINVAIGYAVLPVPYFFQNLKEVAYRL